MISDFGLDDVEDIDDLSREHRQQIEVVIDHFDLDFETPEEFAEIALNTRKAIEERVEEDSAADVSVDTDGHSDSEGILVEGDYTEEYGTESVNVEVEVTPANAFEGSIQFDYGEEFLEIAEENGFPPEILESPGEGAEVVARSGDYPVRVVQSVEDVSKERVTVIVQQAASVGDMFGLTVESRTHFVEGAGEIDTDAAEIDIGGGELSVFLPRR